MAKRYNAEELGNFISESTCWREVCEKYGKKEAGGTISNMKRVADKNNISYLHFTGVGWRKGRSFDKLPIEDYLNNVRKINSHPLKIRLIKEGFKKHVCELCGLSEWNGAKIPLELDHKDSNHYNNNLDNLQIICPNCHALETRNRLIAKRSKKRVKSNVVDRRRVRKVRIEHRKVERPSLEILLEEIAQLNYTGTGRKYGVSDNAVRKWVKAYQHESVLLV